MSEEANNTLKVNDREQSVAVKLFMVVLPYLISAVIGAGGGIITARSEVSLLQYQVQELQEKYEQDLTTQLQTQERIVRLEQIFVTQADTLKRLNDIADKQNAAYDRLLREFDSRFQRIELQLERLKVLIEKDPTRKD